MGGEVDSVGIWEFGIGWKSLPPELLPCLDLKCCSRTTKIPVGIGVCQFLKSARVR